MFFEKQILSNMRTAIITGHTIFNAILSSCNNDMSALQFFNYDTKIKVPPISKALTCKEIYRYKQKWHKQKWHFCQGDSSAYFLYEQFVISNGLIYIPTLGFSVLLAACLSGILVTSWYDSVCVTVTCLVNFTQRYLHEHELQLSDLNVYQYFRVQM